jgi:CRP-like cAMP-binding protein
VKLETGLFPTGSKAMLVQQATRTNKLLNKLPETTFSRLQPFMKLVDLPLKTVLVEPLEETSHVYFIESGLASVTANSPDGEVIEVGHIGREGMAGIHIVLMTKRTPSRTFVQVAGSAVAIRSEDFFRIIEESFEARRFLLRYAQCYQVQLAYTALANARYSLSQRLARWLLMCHDRINEVELVLTHEFLSIMLGVRRSGVTEQLHILEGLHAIRSTRGIIQVRDRVKLEEIAGGCYGVPETEYERLMEQALTESNDTRSSKASTGVQEKHSSFSLRASN